MNERAQHICSEWSADFSARGMADEAEFWNAVKLAFVAGTLPGEMLEKALRQAERRSSITAPEGLDEETLEALNQIKSEAGYLAEAMRGMKGGK